MKTKLVILCGLTFLVASARAQETSQVNDANNPLTPKITLNLQDQYGASYYGLDDNDSNAALIRGVVPLKLFGLPQIIRFTLPIQTSLALPDRDTGLGDLNLFDVAIFKVGKFEIGIGPQLTIPIATAHSLGTGKWQAGAVALVIAPQKWGLVGGLVTYQHSFAGPDGRGDVQNISAQPLAIYNLPGGYYLRSTATWNFNTQTGDYYIPVGAGFGKVWVLKNGTTINAFAEPQYTVAHEGIAPQWQVFAGLNFQFPIHGAAKAPEQSMEK